jgi:hypothetical protein
MRALTLLMVLIVLAAAPPQPGHAKGVLERIELTAESGSRVEVTEGIALYEFNPWASRYLDGVVSDPPALGRVIDVGLYLDMTGNGQERIYSFTYATALSGDGGYIYIPGPGHPDFRRNISTVLSSPGGWQNGAWHRASAAWVAFVASLMAISPPATGDAGLR